MITVKLKNLTLKFCFGFFFILAISSLDAGSYALWSLLFCLLHELGHVFLMLIFNIKVSEMKFYGAGIKITSSGIEPLPNHQKTLIYLGGCAVNLTLAITLGQIGYNDLALINAVIFIFNLLPIYHFDGGRILALYLSGRITKLLSCIFAVLVSIAMVLCLLYSLGNGGLITIICLVFILLCEMLE